MRGARWRAPSPPCNVSLHGGINAIAEAKVITAPFTETIDTTEATTDAEDAAINVVGCGFHEALDVVRLRGGH